MNIKNVNIDLKKMNKIIENLMLNYEYKNLSHSNLLIL